MFGWLNSRSPRSRSLGYGFIYAHGDEIERFSVGAGEVVRNRNRKAPWIVVNRDLVSATIARWPGRLWRVEVLDEISADEERRLRCERTAEGRAKYSRAVAVRMIEQLSPGLLFGENGARVAAVLDRAHALDKQQAIRLAQARLDDATQARATAWTAWLGDKPPSEIHSVDSLGNYLGGFGMGPRSPVNSALTLIDTEVSRRAEAIDGDAAHVVYPDDPEGAWLIDPWSTASAALGDAAMAFGAPDLLTPEGRDLLAAPWRTVFGADPA